MEERPTATEDQIYSCVITHRNNRIILSRERKNLNQFTMSKVVEDVKSGVKAVRGAGDALRGSVMEVADQAFDSNPSHPKTAAAQTKNHTLAEKGKQDMHVADAEIGARERQRDAGRAAMTGSAREPYNHQHHQPSTTTTATTTTTEANIPHATESRTALVSDTNDMARPVDPQFR